LVFEYALSEDKERFPKHVADLNAYCRMDLLTCSCIGT